MTNDCASPDFSALHHWLAAYFAGEGQTLPSWQPLRGDAGFRRYFRLACTPPLLAVYAPPASENSQAFVAIAHYLRSFHLPAPAILAVDYVQGFLLIEDLGPDLYLPQLQANGVEVFYAQALQTLLQLQQVPIDKQIFPAYDQATLRRELELLPHWFIEQLLGYPLNRDERILLQGCFTQLEQAANQQPRCIVHRDFHSRNLIVRRDAAGQLLAPGLIDFQDALAGPVTYDLVSLLRDCYVHWPRAQVERWVKQYQQRAQAAGIIPPLREGEFLRWFDWMGLQRHMKVLGIFARLSLRDGKHHYLHDLPLVLAYTLSVARRYCEFGPLVVWIERQLLPRIQAQPWYRALEVDL